MKHWLAINLLRLANWIREWLWMTPEPIATCQLCGRSFIATPDNLVEVGLTVLANHSDEDPAHPNLEGVDAVTLTISDFREGYHIDEEAMDALRSAEAGDRIATGAEHWCDHCIMEHFTAS